MSRIHSIPGTIVSSALFCGKSSAFIIEPQSAWNVRMDRRNGDLDLQTYYSAEASTQKGRRMHQNTHMGLPKIKKNLARGTAPPQTLPNGKLTSLSTLHPIFSVSARLRRSILAPSALYSCVFGASPGRAQTPYPGSVHCRLLVRSCCGCKSREHRRPNAVHTKLLDKTNSSKDAINTNSTPNNTEHSG